MEVEPIKPTNKHPRLESVIPVRGRATPPESKLLAAVPKGSSVAVGTAAPTAWRRRRLSGCRDSCPTIQRCVGGASKGPHRGNKRGGAAEGVAEAVEADKLNKYSFTVKLRIHDI
jgi:hypothetical protein